MADSADTALRDHLTEVGDISYPIPVRPVQPRNVKLREAYVLVSKQVKQLRFQEGWYTGRPWSHALYDIYGLYSIHDYVLDPSNSRRKCMKMHRFTS